MSKLFNMDNPFWAAMGKVADLIVLNFLFIVCCIPVFTIGASWTALYFVTIRMVKKEEGYIIKDFFRSFKENFKQATGIWLLILLLAAVFFLDFKVYKLLPGTISKVLTVIATVLAVVVFITAIYVFPILSRFVNSVRNTIKNAFLISIMHVPYTILFVILFFLPFVGLAFFIWIAPLVIMLGFSAPAYWASVLWVRIFKKFEPKDDEEIPE